MQVSSCNNRFICLKWCEKSVKEQQQTVVQAIEELNYYPDFTAVSLSKGKSNLIGIMFPLIDDSFAAVKKENPY